MVIWVKENEMEAFLPLIPGEMRQKVKSGEWFCLGALADPKETSGETEDEKVAAGVLLFSSEEGISYGEELHVMIELHWLYVIEDRRMEGLANELMQALSDILEDNPAEGIICDIPLGSEYDLAKDFFESWGFSFEVTELQEMTITKEDCRREVSPQNKEEALKLASGPARPVELISVSELSEESFKEAIHAMKEEERSGYYDRLSENRDDYAGDMSYAVIHENAVSSIILFERLQSGDLHLVMLESLSQRGAKELLELLRYCAGYYYLNYPEGAKVKFSLGIERSRNLAVHLFPDKAPVQVRRGYFY